MLQSTSFKSTIISLIIFSAFLTNSSFSAKLPVKFFFGHERQVLSTAFSPSGQILASAGGKMIRLWDTQGTKELGKLTGHDTRIISLDFSSQGLLASSSEAGSIILWDVEKSKKIRELSGHKGAISSVAFSPDGQRLVSGSNDHLIKVWEVDTGQELATLRGHTDAVFAVSFSPDGSLIASGSADETVRLWNADTYQQIKVFQDHTGYVWTLDFSPDGTQLASGSWDGGVRLWNLEEFGESELLANFNTFVSVVDYSPNGKLLAVGLLNCESENTIRIWHLKSRKEFTAFETKSVHSLSFSPEHKGIVASGSSDGMIKMWNSIADNTPIPSLPKSDTLIQTPYVTLAWNEAFGAVYYEIEIAKDKDFMDVVQSVTPTAYENFEYEVGSEVRYWWHVRSCGFDEVGSWSSALSFKTRPDLPEKSIIRVSPPRIQVYKNENFEVDVKIENAKELAEFQVDHFTYNPEVLELIELRNIGKIFGSLNVTLVERPKIDNEEGTVSNIVVAKEGNRAVSDNGILFTAKFESKSAGVSDLQLRNVVLGDLKHNRLKCEFVWGNVQVIERILSYDINKDGKIDILDLTLVGKNFGKKIPPDAKPNPDLNRDGIVDDKDLKLVNEHLGENYYMPPEPPEFGPPPPPASAPAELKLQPIGGQPKNWLGQNYPNPFNPETWIPYSLSQNSQVTIDIYNSQGEKVRTLNPGYQLTGEYIDRGSAAHWDGRNELGEKVKSGVYFYSIHTHNFTKTKKMVILK